MTDTAQQHPAENMAAPRAPRAPREEHVWSEHGVERSDPYAWMRDRDDPRTLAHLHAENAYTEAVLAHTAPFRERLFDELVGRIEEDDVSAPYRKGDYWYYSRIGKGMSYRVYCRRAGDPDAPEEVLLDVESLAAGTDYFDLGELETSPDGRLLAYSVDTEGAEKFTLYFKDLSTGELLPDTIENTAGEGEWSADGSCYYYLELDDIQRPWRVKRHRMGGGPARRDEVVYRESDPMFHVGLYSSQDGTRLFAYSESKTSTEVSVLASGDTVGRFEVVFERRAGIRYWLEHHGGEYLVRTNEHARNYKLLAVPAVAHPDLRAARLVLPHREDVRFRGVLPLRGHLVFFERKRGQDQVRILDLVRHNEYMLRMPETVCVLEEGINEEFDTAVVRFNHASPITPDTVFEYDLETHERRILKRRRVPSGHDPDAYTTYRIDALAADGTEVPITLFHRRDLALDGTHPCLLHGYGAYGDTTEPGFDATWLSFLERGFVCAVAHVRGGGLLGEDWYQAGKFLQKKNTFTDFIRCAETLIERGYTQPARLAISGISAGGLLIGAVLNARPELFRVAVAEVPFVDVLTTMLDETIPLTTFEWEEWGDPRDKAYFDYIRSYSPFDNVRAQAYPALLVTAGLNDPRVPFWEPAKWVARLRELKTDDNVLLLKTYLDAGHLGATGRYGYLRDVAFTQAFILWQLGFVPEGA